MFEDDGSRVQVVSEDKKSRVPNSRVFSLFKMYFMCKMFEDNLLYQIDILNGDQQKQKVLYTLEIDNNVI